MDLTFRLGRLRPLRADDVGAIVRGLGDRAVWRNLRENVPHPYAESDAHAFLKSLEERPASDLAGIEVGGELCGAIGLHRLDDVYRSTAEIGFWVGRAFQGRGIASAAVPAAVRHAFERQPDLVRVEGQVFGWNAPSRRVLQKSGFTLEGTLRRAVTKGGEVTDLLIYSVLRGEPLVGD